MFLCGPFFSVASHRTKNACSAAFTVGNTTVKALKLALSALKNTQKHNTSPKRRCLAAAHVLFAGPRNLSSGKASRSGSLKNHTSRKHCL
ncbi:hypothetical protein GDO78_000518 [Eleutherodactylus coqui]|uniref:Uncharacterized protein n=1 Tax=Eleutherodactylus coqui TaxID=57060 RepID=A0A8J6KGE6_ELECQ|nr:hypothetical protein GDO78_000518 [Eleutherodactylus coqui]